MSKLLLLCGCLSFLLAENVLVYREEGRFGGWPANHGIWSWGNEILVGFSAAYFQAKPADRHQANSDRPEEARLARSHDGGKTWKIEAPAHLLAPGQPGEKPVPLTQAMDFTAPGFVMAIRFTSVHKGPSLLFYSTDKGHNWKGPFEFPLFNQLGIAARTDYVVNSRRDALVFLTAAKSNGREGRPICVRTKDGGLTWQFQSYIGPEPSGFAIMPTTVRLGPGRLLTSIRVKEGDTLNFQDTYVSEDDGANWKFLNRAADTGHHSGSGASLIKLKDGRLCLTYGYRAEPFGIRARISTDQGKTWGEEIRLRADGAAWDLGYTRSVQRPDGKIVTVYYFNDGPHNERFIEATIWDPPPTRPVQ